MNKVILSHYIFLSDDKIIYGNSEGIGRPSGSMYAKLRGGKTARFLVSKAVISGVDFTDPQILI